MKLNQIYSNFHSEFDGSVVYLNVTGTAPRLGISSGTLTSLNNQMGFVDSAYNTYKDPLLHTEASTLNMKMKFDAAHPIWAGVQQMLKNNVEITLTADDISALHIHIDHPHGHVIPAVNFAPSNVVIKQTHLVTRIFTFNPTDGHQSDKHKPPTVGKIGREMAIVKIGDPVPTGDQYKTLDSIGVVQYDLIFAPENLNYEAYLVTWYISPTGEASVKSLPLKFTII
jgi:hypothetical protein